MFNTQNALSSFKKLDHQQKVNKLIGVVEKLKKIPSLQDIYNYLTKAKNPISDEVLVGYYTIVLGMIENVQAKDATHIQTSITTTKKISSSANRVQEEDIQEAENMINNL